MDLIPALGAIDPRILARIDINGVLPHSLCVSRSLMDIRALCGAHTAPRRRYSPFPRGRESPVTAHA